MRPGITVDVSTADRVPLEAIVADRNSPQKHVWRSRIVLLTSDGIGTNEIMRRTGKTKTVVWRWQEPFMQEGVAGLLRDKTRPSRIAPLEPEVAARVVALTQADPSGEVTHWTAARNGRAGEDQCLLGAAHLAGARAPACQIALNHDPHFAPNRDPIVAVFEIAG